MGQEVGGRCSGSAPGAPARWRRRQALGSSRPPGRRAPGEQGGYALVWFAVMLTVLMGFVGLAVDLGNWYIHIQRAQRAADAAALDGDVLMPKDFAGAVTAAKAGLIRNKVPSSSVVGGTTSATAYRTSMVSISAVAGKPNDLRVSVTTTVDNAFLRILRLGKTQTFTRTAQATHLPALHIGTGTNMLGGIQPGGAALASNWGKLGATDSHYWLGIQGYDTPKQDGDRWSTHSCTVAGGWGCAGATNNEQDDLEYDYRIHVAAKPGGGSAWLTLEGYDPGYAQTKGECSNPTYNSGVPHNGTASYCAGDELYDHPDSFRAPSTTYQLLRSTDDLRAVPGTTCRTFAGTQNASTAMGDGSFDSSWIHAWALLCTPLRIDLSQPHDYVLRVTSGRGDGVNDFLLQAGLLSASLPMSTTDHQASAAEIALSQQLVTIAADKTFAVDNRFEAVNSTFPFVQVPADYAGRTIHFEFYDIGDANEDGTVTLRSDWGPTTAAGGSCTYRISQDGTSFGPTQTAVGCQMPARAVYDAKLVAFDWTVPSTYNCFPSSQLRSAGCWAYVQMFYPANSVPDDFTTWTLDMPGYPIRLTKVG